MLALCRQEARTATRIAVTLQFTEGTHVMYDAVVIGGGVVGCAILRELCCHEGALLKIPVFTASTETPSQVDS